MGINMLFDTFFYILAKDRRSPVSIIAVGIGLRLGFKAEFVALALKSTALALANCHRP